jgi:pimeloyl-ACP methyl ester carboxylesterase
MAATLIRAALPAAILTLLPPHFSSGFYFQQAVVTPKKRSQSSAFTSTVAAGADRVTSFWEWKGHDIFAEVRIAHKTEGDRNVKTPSCILLHGLGASTTYWRETMSVLQKEGYDVHALDLLGQGRSSKPIYLGENASSMPFKYDVDATPLGMVMGKSSNRNEEYSINLWAKIVDDYARYRRLDDVVLMGNSLGSLVALSAATGEFMNSTNDGEEISAYLTGNTLDGRSRVKGLCLFNCAVGMNSRNVIKNPSFNPLQRAVLNRLFDVINCLVFENKIVLRFILNVVVTKEWVKDALKRLYMYSPERVDKELIDSFYYPAKMGGEGAVEAIRQIHTNDAGLTPMEYHQKYPEILDSLPLHLIWGLKDAITPIHGQVGLFYCDRVANNRGRNGRTTIDVVKSGHMPFDDNPLETHGALLRWLEKI